jgi:ComF family protein
MSASPSFTKELPKRVWSALLDAIFPPHCIGCEEWSRDAFCPLCIPKLRPIKAPLCHHCGEPFDPFSLPAAQCARCRAKTPQFEVARATFHFDGPPREAVHRLKYREKTALAARMAPFLATTFRQDPTLSGFTPHWIVPIPLHSRRLKKRGFNQSALLARELGRILDVPTAHLLQRTRDTTPQVELKRADRAKNMRDAFAVDMDAFAKTGAKGRRILLIDDVLTTGATLDEAARVLKKAGAAEICAISFAR